MHGCPEVLLRCHRATIGDVVENDGCWRGADSSHVVDVVIDAGKVLVLVPAPVERHRHRVGVGPCRQMVTVSGSPEGSPNGSVDFEKKPTAEQGHRVV